MYLVAVTYTFLPKEKSSLSRIKCSKLLATCGEVYPEYRTVIIIIILFHVFDHNLTIDSFLAVRTGEGLYSKMIICKYIGVTNWKGNLLLVSV